MAVFNQRDHKKRERGWGRKKVENVQTHGWRYQTFKMSFQYFLRVSIGLIW